MHLDIDIDFLRETKPHLEAAFRRGNFFAQHTRKFVADTIKLAEPFLESYAKHPMPSDEAFGLAKSQLRQDFKHAKAFTGNEAKVDELNIVARAYASLVQLQVRQLAAFSQMKRAL